MGAPDTAQREHDKRDFPAALRGLRELVGAASGVNALLSAIAHLASQAIPGVDGVSVASFHVVDRLLQVRAWQISAPFIRDVDILQYVQLNQGPCIACTTARRPIVTRSLTTDVRWQRLAAKVINLGVESAMSIPVLTDENLIGSINCYAHGRDAFGHNEVQLGTIFARAAAESLDTAESAALSPPSSWKAPRP